MNDNPKLLIFSLSDRSETVSLTIDLLSDWIAIVSLSSGPP